MNVLLDGIYVKPLIDLMGLDCESIVLFTYKNYKSISRFWHSPSVIRRNLRIDDEIVITKKEYQKIIALLPLVDKPIEAFEMVYPDYFN